MVDLRPLLFINVLMIMLLLTAGFVQVNETDTFAGTEIPAATVPASQSDNASQDASIAKPDDTSAPDKVANKTSASEKKAAQAPSLKEQSPPKANNTPPQKVQVTQVEDAIFADEVLPPHKDQKTLEAIKHLDTAGSNEEPMVIAYQNEPKAKPQPRPSKPAITTGKLIVRSNVHDDTVLVNGKPYGPTKLELELTPGSYSIEVAKPGYSSWNKQIDIRRGMTETLSARLNHYTKVEYLNGVWKHDIMTGEGTFREAGSMEYDGAFVNGKFHGNGSVRYANGMKYQGDWFEGTMRGHGSLTTIEGDTYIGEFDENKFNGEGTLTKATGDIYTGFWINGELNGQGSLTTKDGLLYVGGFSDNLFHGNGSLTYPDGGHYEGSFSNGLFHGKGTEIYPNGKKYVGQFIDGLYHGKGEILNPNGSKITGTFKDGKPFGKATLTTAEGEVFTARSSEPGVCYRLKSYRATACPELEGW